MQLGHVNTLELEARMPRIHYSQKVCPQTVGDILGVFDSESKPSRQMMQLIYVEFFQQFFLFEKKKNYNLTERKLNLCE